MMDRSTHHCPIQTSSLDPNQANPPIAAVDFLNHQSEPSSGRWTNESRDEIFSTNRIVAR